MHWDDESLNLSRPIIFSKKIPKVFLENILVYIQANFNRKY